MSGRERDNTCFHLHGFIRGMAERNFGHCSFQLVLFKCDWFEESQLFFFFGINM